MKNHRITATRLLRIATAGALVAGLYLQAGCTVYVMNPPDSSAQPASPQPQPDPAETYSYPNSSTPTGSDQDQPAAPDEQYQAPPQDVQVVYADDLSPYGSWVDVQGYGQCWRPYNRPVGWQPYTVGHWEYCDYGWIWVAEADEAQWGHLCYHYGRWYLDPGYGWVWVPGVVWAPAWVAWRDGGGYCGWAPLPPQCGFGPSVSVVVVDRYVPRERYVYCREGDVNQPRVYQRFVHNDVTVVSQTTNITNITLVNSVVVNRGVEVTNIQRATGRDVQKVELAQASTPEQARQLAGSGKSVVFAPPVVKQAEQKRLQQSQAHPGKDEGVSHAPNQAGNAVGNPGHQPDNGTTHAPVNQPLPNPKVENQQNQNGDQLPDRVGADQHKSEQPKHEAPKSEQPNNNQQPSAGSQEQNKQKQEDAAKQKQEQQQNQEQQKQQQQEQAQKEQQQRAKEQQDAQEKQKEEQEHQEQQRQQQQEQDRQRQEQQRQQQEEQQKQQQEQQQKDQKQKQSQQKQPPAKQNGNGQQSGNN